MYKGGVCLFACFMAEDEGKEKETRSPVAAGCWATIREGSRVGNKN